MIVRLAGLVSKALGGRTMGLALLVVLLSSPDALKLNAAERTSTPYLYDLVQWEIANFPSKWLHRLASIVPWSSHSGEDVDTALREYFALSAQVSRLEAGLVGSAARGDSAAASETVRLQVELDRLLSRRQGLRNEVEEALESAISAVVREERLAAWGGLVFPPVDVRLTDPPKLLVTSPRDRILRTHDVLLDADIRLMEREQIEDRLLNEASLAALVTNLGGVATYPASIPSGYSMGGTLEISAHEWLHHYLFFRPLGQNISRSPEMRTLNETVADIAGREIGRRAYEKVAGGPPSDPSPAHPDHESGEPPFDFRAEMHLTRLRVDGLLADGLIEEAEAYMEERRLLFVEHGFPIRKLNQAYFAFHGTYAESPASISPIADELRELREAAGDLRSFIVLVSGVSSYPKFQAMLEDIRAPTPRGP